MVSLSDALDNIKNQLASGDNVLEVGFMAGATYPDGTSVAEVAVKNEFGDPKEGRVARPFFRRMIAAEKRHWVGDMRSLIQQGHDSNAVLNLLGRRIAEDLQMSIILFTEPKLKPATIAKKGFSKPLIDTGQMKDSITFRTSKEI